MKHNTLFPSYLTDLQSNYAFSGGFYLRLLPVSFIKRQIIKLNLNFT